MFKVEVKIGVTHDDRELEFFLVKWALNEYINDVSMDHKSCEMMAQQLINDFLVPSYGGDRYYEVTVSEDGESDGIVEYIPE
jgi:hypothetical protein